MAVALAGPWLRGVIARRRLGAALLLAALAAAAALGAFLATTPSLLRFPRTAFGGEGADLLFGARLYGEAGWQGIVRASNPATTSASWATPSAGRRCCSLQPALPPSTARRGGGCSGCSPSRSPSSLLLLSLRVAVQRNLMPILPLLAVLAGIGLAGLVRLAASTCPGRARQLAGRRS